MAMQTAFVTGGTGFIGRHLVDRLAGQGCAVRCLVRPGSTLAATTRPGIDAVSGTLDDPASYRDALAGCDTVFHLGGLVAAPRKADLFRINGLSTQWLADACASLPSPPRLVFMSSLAAAGPPPVGRSLRDEGDGPAPVSHYGASKRAGESALQQRADRLPITVLRPGIVYGPGDPKVAAVFQAIRMTGIHFTVGFRTPPLSLIHVDDMVDLTLAAAERGELLDHDAAGDYSPSGYYLACDDRDHPTYWQFGKLVGRALGRRVFVWPLWRWVGRIVGLTAETLFTPDGKGNLLSLDKVREATVRSWACSSAKARDQLGLAPRLPLEARLHETAEWLREHRWL
jgi:dihydroflavonol-4-reductase